LRALLAAAKEHPRAIPELVTLTPESAGDIPEAIRLHDAAIWFLAPSAGESGVHAEDGGR